MIKLVLVRHGQSMWNLENKFTGWTDVELSEKGIEDYSKAIKAGQDTIESYNKKMVALEEAHKEQRENIKKLKEEYD